jgi:hypothetical protein
MNRNIPSMAAPAAIIQGVGWLMLVVGLGGGALAMLGGGPLLWVGLLSAAAGVAYWALFVLIGRLAEFVEFIANVLTQIRDDAAPPIEAEDLEAEPTIDELLRRVAAHKRPAR